MVEGFHLIEVIDKKKFVTAPQAGEKQRGGHGLHTEELGDKYPTCYWHHLVTRGSE
ncbi:hypothetical protein [Marinomonas spartinae]|uniref:hypothetical protein n=1 Tax=Marinomonas spartinae TaxID=1792290 RepID=UPI0018F195AE|nr:hypothetical protein [Marinomonas spartinae]MBJ7554247.1 hypothetical protein [Marinomonas spartinae]